MRAGLLFIFIFCFSSLCFAEREKAKRIVLPTDTLKVAEFLKKSKHYEKSAPSVALSYASKAFFISKQSEYILGEARALSHLAAINLIYHAASQAAEYSKQSLKLYQTFGADRRQELARAYLDFGVYQHNQKHYAAALKSMQQGLSIFRSLNYKPGIFLCYKNIASVYQTLGRKKDALDLLIKAKAIVATGPTDTSYFSLLEHLGNVYMAMDSDERALQAFQEGINKSDAHPLGAQHQVSLLQAMGKFHASNGDESKAISFHKQALDKSIASGKPEEQARSLMALADLFKDRNSSQSILHLNNALQIAKTLNNKVLAAEIYKTLSEIYRQQHRFEEALLALSAHHGLVDTLIEINKNNQNEITQSNLMLQTFKSENERLLLENKQRTLERNAGGILLVLIFLALIFIAYHFYLTRKLNRKLYISNRIKDKLFSIIGHDLRNPIGGIGTMLSLLEQKDLDAKILKSISGMKRQSDLALEILSSLLLWGKSQLQGIKVNTASFAALNVIQKNINLLSQQSLEKDIVILNRVSSDVVVLADTDHFDFIFRNLLSNAIKFSHSGCGISIDAEQEPSHMVWFCVEDAGVGLSEKQLADFKDGGLESSYGTNGEKGTGIGLLLVKEYVKVNGGEIKIESLLGKGSKFYFSLKKPFDN